MSNQYTSIPWPERFWNKVDKKESCWLWTANTRLGYGRVRYQGKYVSAHRIAWEMINGPIPAGKELLHSCDVRNCVNPSHLSVGTRHDNMKDMVKKGRSNSRLTWGNIREIRSLAKSSTITDLSKRFDLALSSTSRIVNRKVWKYDTEVAA